MEVEEMTQALRINREENPQSGKPDEWTQVSQQGRMRITGQWRWNKTKIISHKNHVGKKTRKWTNASSVLKILIQWGEKEPIRSENRGVVVSLRATVTVECEHQEPEEVGSKQLLWKLLTRKRAERWEAGKGIRNQRRNWNFLFLFKKKKKKKGY